MHTQLPSRSRGSILSTLLILVVLVQLAFIGYLLLGGEGKVKKEAQIRAMDVVGSAAVRVMESNRPAPTGDDTHGSSVDLIHNPIELKPLGDDIFYVTGVANTYLIPSSEGNVIFDSGLTIQAAKQILVAREAMADAPLSHIIVSHSHQDHSGGVNLWKEEGTEVVAHREFVEEQRYLAELEPYFFQRNRVLFPWLPEELPDLGMLNYGGVEPTVLVDEGADYRFTRDGREFVVISTPGAEGADNIVLWLPEEKILFSGDFFGPQFPQFPNVFTMRGEKIRKPIEYIRSLNKIIALQPEVIAPAHFSPTSGKEEIMAGLLRTRDAVQYVHDATMEGMKAGKSMWQLMREIELPPELDLPQNHGKVDWAVRSIWEYYSTWFHFESTTELYPYPAREVYPFVGQTVGIEVLLEGAAGYMEQEQPVHALHLVEMALAADPAHQGALDMQLRALQSLKQAAEAGVKNDYEIFWLRKQIGDTEAALGRISGTLDDYQSIDVKQMMSEQQ